MIVIDSSAMIAVLRREPEADRFLQIISETEGCLLPAVSFLETSMVLAGRTGDQSSWTEFDALISRAEITVVPHDAELAEAARASFLRYGRGRHPADLNLGDCASYALARHLDVPLLFMGEDFSKTDLRAVA